MRPPFHQPTVDPLFKHLMGHEVVRNSLLTAILKEPVSYSQLIDGALNPFPAFKGLRSLINRPELAELMDQLGELSAKELPDRKNNPLVNKALVFMRELAPLYAELSSALPSAERQTQLDIVCETSYGLVTVEMQVSPQNYWDVRILDHVCGLFHRQFARGFKWSSLETDPDIASKISRVVGISLFAKAPMYPGKVQALLPWYEAEGWEVDELSRHYRLLEAKRPRKVRPGIEFFDFNLEAFIFLHANGGLEAYPKDLCAWLDFFARAHTKTIAEIEEGDYSEPIKKAYDIIKDLPPNIEEMYTESLIRQADISHFVEGTKEQAMAEGEARGEAKARAENLAEKKTIANNLISKGMLIAEISDITGLSIAEVERLKL